MEEEFKVILDFPSYQISNKGTIKNIQRGTIVKPSKAKSDYYYFQVMKNSKKHNLYIHKLIGEYFIPNPDNKTIVDHIDRNRTNNDISNLRWASKSENAINCKIREDNTSGCRGVCFNKRSKLWLARINLNNSVTNIGYFKNYEDAVIARQNKELELYGEFRPNII